MHLPAAARRPGLARAAISFGAPEVQGLPPRLSAERGMIGRAFQEQRVFVAADREKFDRAAEFVVPGEGAVRRG